MLFIYYDSSSYYYYDYHYFSVVVESIANLLCLHFRYYLFQKKKQEKKKEKQKDKRSNHAPCLTFLVLKLRLVRKTARLGSEPGINDIRSRTLRYSSHLFFLCIKVLLRKIVLVKLLFSPSSSSSSSSHRVALYLFFRVMRFCILSSERNAQSGSTPTLKLSHRHGQAIHTLSFLRALGA